jgi:hypothetical protein
MCVGNTEVRAEAGTARVGRRGINVPRGSDKAASASRPTGCYRLSGAPPVLQCDALEGVTRLGIAVGTVSPPHVDAPAPVDEEHPDYLE